MRVVISSLNVSGILQRSYPGLEFSFFIFFICELTSFDYESYSGSLFFLSEL